MVLSAFKTPAELIRFSFLPESFSLDNFKTVLGSGSFLRWYGNSFLIASMVTLSVLFFSLMAGYAIAKYRFRGKQAVFYTMLSTMMIPLEMLVIPWFILGNGLINTFTGIALPGMISAFGIFLIKQSAEQIPDSLIEAARVDGAGEMRILFQIVMPQLRPALASLGIFTFLGNWNAFLWPLIITNEQSMFTLPVGLQYFSGQHTSEFHLIMAGATLTVIPVLVVFIVLQKHIIKGIALTGIK